MRIEFSILMRPLVLSAFFFLPVAFALPAQAGDLKLEALLIWGTDDPKSPDPNHKPAPPDVEKKLKSLPLKWNHFFEVNRQQFAVAENGSTTVTMSKDCVITVKNLGDTKVEVGLVGKGERTCKITRPLPKGELLVTGGNAPNVTGWFVVLRQVQ